jgi:hypothetical protein
MIPEIRQHGFIHDDEVGPGDEIGRGWVRRRVW